MSNLIGQNIRNYHLAEVIGSGGHGTVYKGWDTQTHNTIAIKVMLSKHIKDEIVVQRLHQEADIIRDLRHPHIVPLIESWDDEHGVCLVMPWIDGEDLRRLMQRKPELSPREITAILTQICSALDATHAAGIIHRDIKPENILLDSYGTAYLSDFGFAKRKDNNTFSTTAGVIVGTAYYLSPEQITESELSNRTDIFAIGIMIYEMLTGKHPFGETNSRVKILMYLLKEDMPLIERGDIPEHKLKQINMLIARCTAKNPDERYLTASSVAYHFAQITDISISPPNI